MRKDGAARTKPRKPLPSHLDAWLAAKIADPVKWQREWDEAKKTLDSERTNS